MSTDPQGTNTKTNIVAAASGGISAPDEFLSLRVMLGMVFKHRRAIAAFVLLITLAAGILFISLPKQFEAEGFLQVIAPAPQEGRVDKDLYETMIVSHLQKVASAFMGRNVAALLTNQGMPTEPLVLKKKIKIIRPSKTNLIRVTAKATSADQALLIVRLWIREYLSTLEINNIHSALSQIRGQFRQAQSELMEKQAAVDKLRAQISQTTPLVTLSRAVDDRQIWSDLAQTTVPASDDFKKLAEIHIKGQEQSAEYVNLKNRVAESEQALAAVAARRNLYREVARILEERITVNVSFQETKAALTNVPAAEFELYVEMLTKTSSIIQFGEPGLISAGRGALKKTGAVFLAALALACFAAFLREWGKGLLSV